MTLEYEMTRYRVGLDESGTNEHLLAWLDAHLEDDVDSVDLVMIGTTLGVTPGEAGALLRDASEELRRDHRDLRVTEEFVAGLSVRPLLEEGLPGDVLVLGVDATTRWSDALAAWTVDRASVHAQIPVVAVPDRTRGGSDRLGPAAVADPIVVGIDETTADAAVSFAADRALVEGRELVIVHAWQVPTVSTPYGYAFVEQDPGLWEHLAERLVRQAASAVRSQFPGLRVESRVGEGRPARVIVGTAETASLLVVGRRHRTVVGGALFGSVGHELLRLSVAPVCIVPPALAPDIPARDGIVPEPALKKRAAR
jgi:nucleotide-binding universal stress UspA family protein